MGLKVDADGPSRPEGLGSISMLKTASLMIVLVAGIVVVAFAGEPQPRTPPKPGLVLRAVVAEDAYDGDTFEAYVSVRVRVRMLDCWAPEVRGGTEETKAAGFASRDSLRRLIPSGSQVLLEIPTTGRLRDSLSLSRPLAHVWADVDGDGELDNIAELQRSAGHATASKEK